MKRIVLIFLMLFCSFVLYCENVVQRGYVRSVGRPHNLQGTRLKNAVIYINGMHNPILSNENGEFEIVFDNPHVGVDGFRISNIRLRGYELNEKELIGRLLVISPTVPLEIVMVSLKEKMEIEDRIRARIEISYAERLKELEAQRDEYGKEVYEQAKKELQSMYEKRERLIPDMVERYSHTDYAKLTETEVKINAFVEDGDLERADSVIQTLNIEQLEEDRIALKKDVEERSKELVSERGARKTIDKNLLETFAKEFRYQIECRNEEKAQEYLEKMLNIDSTDIHLMALSGDFFFQWKQDTVKALRYYHSVVENPVNDNNIVIAHCYDRIGDMYFSRNDYAASVEAYRKAYQIYLDSGEHHLSWIDKIKRKLAVASQHVDGSF